MSKLFLLHYSTEIFATFINDLSKPIIIACPDQNRAINLRKTLMTHKRKKNKWLNIHKTLDITSNNTIKIYTNVNINLIEHHT